MGVQRCVNPTKDGYPKMRQSLEDGYAKMRKSYQGLVCKAALIRLINDVQQLDNQ